MSHKTSAQVIADSITTYGPEMRLTSIYVVFPKMVLAERNRHRCFSLSDRSSRAVPPEKLIAEVREDPAMPAKFRRRTKGMGGGEELVADALWRAEDDWIWCSTVACDQAELTLIGKHDLAKEIVNRVLDPYVRMHSLMTATRDGWLNFFGLRLDSGADPTIQVLAQKCFEAYRDSMPRLLELSQWHLPFVDYAEEFNGVPAERVVSNHVDIAIKISAARCAHLSYNDLETGKRMTVERALSIYDKLVGSRPIHASPCEHQATPDEWDGTLGWRWPRESGNFCWGWRQFRKMLSGEAVAPLPDGYTLQG